MARIDLPEKGWVPSSVWEIYTQAENRVGYIPNTLKATSHSIRSMRAIDQFLEVYEQQGTLDSELRILASLAATKRNNNEYGVDQVRSQARRFFVSDDKMEKVLDDDLATLDPREQAIIRFAQAMTDKADAGEEVLEAVREFLSEEKIVELTFIVAGRNFLDRIQCTFEIDPEPELTAGLN